MTLKAYTQCTFTFKDLNMRYEYVSLSTGRVISVISGVCSFIVGLLSGVLVGVVTMVVYIKCRKNRSKTPVTSSVHHTPPLHKNYVDNPAPPIYEVLGLPGASNPLEMEIQENNAYVHMN